jgi:hypothetical protein
MHVRAHKVHENRREPLICTSNEPPEVTAPRQSLPEHRKNEAPGSHSTSSLIDLRKVPLVEGVTE